MLCVEPKNHKHFRPGARLGGSVTGVTEKLLLGIGNGGGKQGRSNQPPYRRYGPDTEIQYRSQHMDLAKPSRILSKREADTEFQYRPHIVDTDIDCRRIFADAISETPTKKSENLINLIALLSLASKLIIEWFRRGWYARLRLRAVTHIYQGRIRKGKGT